MTAPPAPPPPAAGEAAIVIPVHNRRETTLRGLAHLRELGALAWARVLVVDDGSTDGTADAVRAGFPEVEIVPGDGNLWWGGATALGSTRALATGARIVFWLNDDCLPRPGTLERLAAVVRARDAVAVSQVYTPHGPICGGYHRTATGLTNRVCPPGAESPCDAYAGNCVGLPRAALAGAANVDAAALPHLFADLDHGLRAVRAGRPRAVVLGDAPSDSSEGDRRPLSRSLLLGDRPLSEVWRGLGQVRSIYYAPAVLRFHLRHWGWLVGGAICLKTYGKLLAITLLRVLVPRPWLRRWRGGRSVEWRAAELYLAGEEGRSGPGKP